jgi:hypothetical protein
MNETTPDQRRAVIPAVLAASRRRLTLGALARRLLFLAALVVVFPLVVVIADHLAPNGLPHTLIFGAGILWAFATVLTAVTVLIRTLVRRMNAAFVAQHMERSWGLLHNPLVNMVLLQRSAEAGYAQDVATRQAASAVAAVGPDERRNPLGLGRPGLISLAAIGLWVLYAAVTPKPIGPSLARLFGSDRPAPTATRLELVHPRPDQPVYAGEPLDIEFVRSGRPVARVWLELSDPTAADGDPMLRRVLPPGEEPGTADRHRISLAAHEVQGDLHYRCSAGDAVLEGVIPVRPRPDLVGLDVELTPPAYVEQPVSRSRTPELHAWVGTRAAFVATANTEMVDPVFVFRAQSETRTRMSVDSAAPRRAVLTVPLIDSGEYWIEFFDRWGRACCDPPVHRVAVRPDEPPQVEIVTPTREEAPGDVVDAAYVPWLRVVASDDVQLGALSLVREADEVVRQRDLLEASALARGEPIEIGVATADLSLEVGESVVVWFEARDNRVLVDGTPAPQTSRTRALTLVRTPELAPPPVADAAAPSEPDDASTAEESTGATRRVARRKGAGEAGEGESTENADEGNEDRDDSGSPTGKYRRVPGDGADDQTADDADEAPEFIDPDDVIDETGAGDADADEDAADRGSGESTEEAQDFKDELRRFREKHGDEAAEVNRCLGRRKGGESPEAQPGQDGAPGGGEGGSPPETLGSDEQGDAGAPNEHELEPADIGEVEVEESDQVEPESQPSPTEQPETEAAGSPPQSDDGSSESGSPQRESHESGTDENEKPSSDESDTPNGEAAPGPAGEPAGGGTERSPDESQSDGGDITQEKQDRGHEPAQSEQQSEPPPGSQEAAETSAPEPEPSPEQSPQADGGDGERVLPFPNQDGPQPPEAPSEEPAPPSDDTGGRSELTDTLDLLERAGSVSDDDLAGLGWPPEKKRAFIDDFARLREAARRAGVLAQLRWWRTELALGSDEVQAGAGLSRELSTDVQARESLRDGLDKIAPPREQHVPPALEALLEAYYRSLAEKRVGEAAAEGLP